ncbi:hypothetical protein Y032_0025g1269 [Ancylostoma ceylanicum]|uniref:Uncharacterized protein n=1 Tax=Ancylostoma ceylanicum TaxID=53326 RepID=A0A016UXP7_9BILA|nr:hypothetical protein Y032_0025g1269 [Ancylostoma ceylanicum]
MAGLKLPLTPSSILAAIEGRMGALMGKATPKMGFETEAILLEKCVRAAIELPSYLRLLIGLPMGFMT